MMMMMMMMMMMDQTGRSRLGHCACVTGQALKLTGHAYMTSDEDGNNRHSVVGMIQLQRYTLPRSIY